MKRLPVRAERRKNRLIPNDLAVFEEVQVYGAAFQVNAVHSLGAASLEVDGLLFGCTRQFAAGDHKALVSGVLDQFAGIQQECSLLSA